MTTSLIIPELTPTEGASYKEYTDLPAKIIFGN
jgi:hypothetical protein